MGVLSEQELARRAAELEWLLCDADGVLTDGGLYYDHRGFRLQRFNAKDGLGLKLAQRAGLKVGHPLGPRLEGRREAQRRAQAGRLPDRHPRQAGRARGVPGAPQHRPPTSRLHRRRSPRSGGAEPFGPFLRPRRRGPGGPHRGPPGAGGRRRPRRRPRDGGDHPPRPRGVGRDLLPVYLRRLSPHPLTSPCRWPAQKGKSSAPR